MKKAILIVGILGMVLSLCVFGVSVSLPIINGPRTSWEEALAGIIPGGVCCALFSILALVGLILVLMAPASEAPSKKRKQEEDDDADEEGNDDD